MLEIRLSAPVSMNSFTWIPHRRVDALLTKSYERAQERMSNSHEAVLRDETVDSVSKAVEGKLLRGRLASLETCGCPIPSAKSPLI